MGALSKKQLLVLQALRDAGGPLNGGEVAAQLTGAGADISERTVRLHFAALDRAGFTVSMGRRGRRITEKGLLELRAGTSYQRVGLLSAKIDRMTYRMDFDPVTRAGRLVVNVSMIDPSGFRQYLPLVSRVFERGFAMGRLVSLLRPGERCGEWEVPRGRLGFCTVCSITLNGVLLKYGIPVHSRFGGLLELSGGKATRFAEIIMYDGTSIDPLEVFIRGGLTDYLGAIRNGTGRIGAGFREVPAESCDRVRTLADRLKRMGLGGFWTIGGAGQNLYGIPVSEGLAGVVVIGGLNPVAVFEESGVRIDSRALSGLMPFDRLFDYTELSARLSSL